ncbi:phosphotransferase enzyme family protein [Phytoactinopolyspora halotolerans]|uniref:Phosphotransferase n=1 Tax=Phytoactinopolyspora halotolerans TaxID=1981512 RepID=A0A6L9SGT7_9ACTN|nr:phosphotransferase [Phytoactinopolyspora halotolerans]NEE03834.1 phosphotransferase [Phytoactinopolyspora halotolerans]
MDAAEIAHRFGLGRSARLSDQPVARGKQGVVWRLDTSDGRWAVKVPLYPVQENDIRAAAAFQEAAVRAGIPAPQLRRTVAGSVLAQVHGTQLRVYEWVDLGGPDPRLDPVMVGSVLATIHVMSESAHGPVADWYSRPVGAAAWDGLVADLRDARAPFARRLSDLRDELVALESWVEPSAELRTCHRDLWADNVRPTAAGGVCVIDWESSGPANQSQELACVLFEFARSAPHRARALMAAYHDAGGPAEVTRRGHFSMLIAQLGHIAESAAATWLHADPGSADRAEAAAGVEEMLAEPHTRRVLDELLNAVHDA